MITVHYADDHKLVAQSISSTLELSGEVTVSKIYPDLKSIRAGLAEEIPDVLLLDIDLPDGYGDDFCKEILEKYPQLKIMIFTGFDELNIARRSLKNGALGYTLKNSDSEEILLGLKTVAEGEQFICEKIDRMMKKHRYEDHIFVSKREREVLLYLSQGLTTAQTGEKMFISEATVKFHRQTLMLKLGAKNAVDLIQKANDQKLIPKN